MAASGASQALVDRQRADIAALSPAEKSRQNELRAKEEPKYANLPSVAPVPIITSNPGRAVHPNVTPVNCFANNSLPPYRIVGNGNGGSIWWACFGGSLGTYSEDLPSAAASLTPGGYTGRVYYNTCYGYYWSTTRGPSSDTYYFTDPNCGVFAIHKIQLLG